MIQLAAGLKERNSRAEVRHIVEILDAAYRNDGRYETGLRPAPPKSRVKPAALVLLALSALLLWLLARRRK